jgi:hypothetical protein
MILDFQAWRGRLPPCGTVNMMENTVNHPRNGCILVLEKGPSTILAGDKV